MKIRLTNNTVVSLSINFAYALAHCAYGFIAHSWWFITLGAYYAILCITRFSVLQVGRRSKGDLEMELFAKKITGILFLILSFCLTGIITLSALDNHASQHHEIVMITLALYSFSKVTLSIIGLVKVKKVASPVAKTLRNITFADALVSIYSLQRSMLVSFPGLTESEIQLFNILTGTGVWLLVLLLGINLIGGKTVNMAKSKIVQANKKIADAVVGGYKKVEGTVVDGYKKVEGAVVSGYTKIEDKFVDAYLTKDGETVEEAKERLKKEKEQQ